METTKHKATQLDLHEVLSPLTRFLTQNLPGENPPRLVAINRIPGLPDVDGSKTALYELTYPPTEDILERLGALVCFAGGNSIGFDRDPDDVAVLTRYPRETPIRFAILEHTTWSVCHSVQTYYLQAVLVDEGDRAAVERQVAQLMDFFARNEPYQISLNTTSLSNLR